MHNGRKRLVGIMFKVRLRTTRPYLCVYVDKGHAARFVRIKSLMAVGVSECVFA